MNSKPLSVDESSITNIPGIVKVVQEGGFVGVVAQTEWAAIQASSSAEGDVVHAGDENAARSR